jgi:hypothetical protein
MNRPNSISFISKLVYLFLISAVLYSCSDNPIVEPPPPPAGPLAIRTVSNLQADTALTGGYTYFRFSDSTVVTGADTATNKWDIAFRNTTIIINGGAVRFGSGGAFVQRNSSFDTVSIAPESDYGVDTSATQLAIKTGSGNGWYNYDFANNYVTPIPATVLIIRTGDGKYAKVEIKSYYYNNDPQPFPNPENYRYYTFRFVYQPDGSRNIK